MHFYSHHIGDFRAGCFNMTRLERALYRDMLDIYYDTEKPLPDSKEDVCKLLGARSDEEKEMVSEILMHKFEQIEGRGWVHERCEKEIAEYHAKADIARANGKLGGRPKKTQQEPRGNPAVTGSEPTDNPDITGSQANHKPITNNHNNSPIPPDGGKPGPAKKEKAAFTLKTYLAECKDQGVKPIPEDDSVFDYAAEAGIGSDVLALHWAEFKARYSLEGAKKYKAWRTVFGKSVRGNWFRLWYFDNNGACMLTTTGIQAKNIAEARKAA